MTGRAFTEDDRVLAAFAGTGFVGGDHTDITEVVEVVELPVLEGLVFDDLEVGALGEDAGDDIEFALAVAFIHPDGGGGIDREKRIGLAGGGSDGIEVAAIIAIGDDLVEPGELLGQADDATPDGNVPRGGRGLGRGEGTGEGQRSDDELAAIGSHSS